jgi:hypothetical protein
VGRLRRWFQFSILVSGLVSRAPVALSEKAIEGEMFARISVTVDPDKSGTIQVPSPFAVLPGGKRLAIYVPESGGVFVLEREDILHHFPYAAEDSRIDDLAAAGDLLVIGQRGTGERITATLGICDLKQGRLLDIVRSANPHLRVEGLGEDLWRLAVTERRVGVYHPPTGATYPLWDAEKGLLDGSEQMAAARAGLGLEGDVAWIPSPDGTLARKERGQTETVSDADVGDFLDVVSDELVLLLQPEIMVRSDAGWDFLLPHELAMRLLHKDGSMNDFTLESMSRDVAASRLVIHGRPVCAHEGRLYWIFLGSDYLEVRSAPVPGLEVGRR